MAVLDRGGSTQTGDGGGIVPIKVGPPPTPVGRMLSIAFGIAAVITGLARYPGACVGFTAVSVVLNLWDLAASRGSGRSEDAARNVASGPVQ